jgi:type II secretory pathway component PulF
MPISTHSLIRLCHRVGMAVRSGVDARRLWETEERHASGRLKNAITLIRRQVTAGGTVAEGMQASDGYFPPMFVHMVAVGEHTGKLDEVLKRLAQHYEHMAAMRRMFLIGIGWPLFELVLAVLVIGLLIFITGIIGAARGTEAPDVLGWGLVGTRGMIIWFMSCGLVAGAIAVAVHAVARGRLGSQPVLAAMRIPVLGPCLEALALSRMTWSLALALDAGMDARRAVTLAISAAQNPYYESAGPRVAAAIRANQQFHESFAAAGVFPADFIQQVEVAEMAGTTSESLLRLAQEYEERAKTAMKTLTLVVTGLVWLVIFGVIIFAIFSLFINAYLKPINDMLKMSESGRI